MPVYRKRPLQDQEHACPRNEHSKVYSESFYVAGIGSLIAQSKSFDSKIIEKIQHQKQVLQTASSRAFQGASGEKELEAVAATTRNMRQFWERLAHKLRISSTASGGHHLLSGVHFDTSTAIEAELVIGENEIRSGHSRNKKIQGSHTAYLAEKEALALSASKMKKFWKTVETKNRQTSSDFYSSGVVLRDVTISVDLSIDESHTQFCRHSILENKSGKGSMILLESEGSSSAITCQQTNVSSSLRL